MPQILLSELRAGLASGKIDESTLGQLKAAGYTVFNDEAGPSLSDQARARHAQLISETQGQIDPQTGMPTYEGTGVMSQIPSTPLGGLAVGALKGAGSTAYNLGNLAHAVGQTMVGQQPTIDSAPNDATDALQTRGGWQKAGKTAEQVAEYFIPGMSAEMAAARGLGTLGRMGVEGLSAAAVGGAQGENPLLTGAGGALGAGVSKAAEAVAPRLINNLIGATRKSFRFGANPGEGVVDQGLMAGSIGALADKIDTAREAVGNKIGTVLGTSPAANTTKINVEALYKPVLDEATKALETSGAGATRIASLEQGINQAFTDLGSAASAATPHEAWQVSDLLKKAVNYGGSEGIEAGMPNVIRTIRAKISDAIADAVPQLKPLNQQYQNLSRAADAVEGKIAGSQGIPSLMRHTTRGTAAGMIGWALHNPALAAGIYGGMEALGTTPVATVAAQAARGLGSEAGTQALARGGAAATGALSESIGSQLQDKFGHDSAVSGLLGSLPQNPAERAQALYDVNAVYVNPDGTIVDIPQHVMHQFRNGVIGGR